MSINSPSAADEEPYIEPTDAGEIYEIIAKHGKFGWEDEISAPPVDHEELKRIAEYLEWTDATARAYDLTKQFRSWHKAFFGHLLAVARRERSTARSRAAVVEGNDDSDDESLDPELRKLLVKVGFLPVYEDEEHAPPLDHDGLQELAERGEWTESTARIYRLTRRFQSWFDVYLSLMERASKKDIGDEINSQSD